MYGTFTKGFFAMIVRLLLALTLLAGSAEATASVADDISAGLPADVVIANAIKEGKTLEEILDEIARIVGSDNIGQFAEAARHTLAVVTGSREESTEVRAAANVAIAATAARNYPPTAAGNAYLAAAGVFTLSTGELLSSIAGNYRTVGSLVPSLESIKGLTGQNLEQLASLNASTGGRVVESALCQAAGSQPGCLSSFLPTLSN